MWCLERCHSNEWHDWRKDSLMLVFRAVVTDESEFHGAVTRLLIRYICREERKQTKILAVNFVSIK